MNFIPQAEPSYGKEEIQAVVDYMNSGGWLMEFKKTREFEELISQFTRAKYCSVVCNGTVSLFIALRALDIGPQDEVIVPDITMAATPNAVILAGAKPVFVDIEKNSLCLDVGKVSEAVNSKTKAVMHVSLNGRAGDLAGLKQLCERENIYLLEDAAQSLGSFYQGKHLGTLGIIGSFSFSAPKIITTGQGGALVTNDLALFEKIKRLKDFGRLQGGADFYEEMGWNFKFTDLQAVIGIQQTKRLQKRMACKKEMYSLYKELLSKVETVKFIETNLEETTPWFMDILVPERDKLIVYLKEKGIGSRPIYPALHSQPAYKEKGSYSVAEKIAEEALWLPSSVTLTNEQIEYICKQINIFFE